MGKEKKAKREGDAVKELDTTGDTPRVRGSVKIHLEPLWNLSLFSFSHLLPFFQYRFVSFSERIARIDVDVYRQDMTTEVRDRPHPPHDTWTEERAHHWRSVASPQYADFLQEAAGALASLPQLVHCADRVVSALLRHLEEALEVRV